MTPLESQRIVFFTPADIRNFDTAIAAAPAPFTTNLISSIFFLTIFKALIKPDKTITAVPCWSSWNTGIFNIFFNPFSISKQRGALISSRLIPPKVGAIKVTASTILSGSLVARQIGKASIPAKCLKRTAFPSITGKAASGPMSPRPKTAVPSVTIATIFPLVVYL
ncbi:hypothetical protein ES708_27596 [subsurface metagenome]